MQPDATAGPPGIVVVGPPLSGVGSLVEALRSRLVGHFVGEPNDLEPGEEVAVVVFVVSAAAPVTRSDLALLDAAASRTDMVLAAVSKIDVHRTWREVLDADRTALASHRQRYRTVSWTGVAARPEIGLPVLDELLTGLASALGRTDIAERNRHRRREYEREAQTERARREDVERRRRAAAVDRRRRDLSARAVALRGDVHQARAQLTGEVRDRCIALRAELSEAAALATPRRAAAIRRQAARRLAQVTDDVDRVVNRRLAEVAVHAGLVPGPDAAAVPTPADVSLPPVRRTALENRLTALLGVGFGVGAALTLARLVTGFVHVGTSALLVGCLVVGGGLGAWVVHARRLLSERAAMERWVTEATLLLRPVLEGRVADRVAAVEAAIGAAVAAL